MNAIPKNLCRVYSPGLRAGIKDALQYCTALVSLKMETPGPFMGTRQDVEDYIKAFY